MVQTAVGEGKSSRLKLAGFGVEQAMKEDSHDLHGEEAAAGDGDE